MKKVSLDFHNNCHGKPGNVMGFFFSKVLSTLNEQKKHKLALSKGRSKLIFSKGVFHIRKVYKNTHFRV